MDVKKKKILKVAIISLAVIILLFGIGAGCIWYYFSENAKTEAVVYINKDSDAKMVQDTLAVHFGDNFASKVIKIAEVADVDWSLRTGAYKIEQGQSAVDVARMFKRKMQTPLKFTFNNVRTLDEFAEIVDRRLLMTADEFMQVVYNDSILNKYGLTKDNVGVLFTPDTYEFYWTVTPEDFVDVMQKYYDKWWTKERRAKAGAYGLTPAEMAVVASIVEEETNRWDERGTVGRLYLNRVEKGMKLQADPTVKFALYDLAKSRGAGDEAEEIFARRRITRVDCDRADSRYNTYKYVGLPPGPIRLADKRTIDAVLNAKPNNYIYMCAKEDFSGRHNFTNSLSQHNANARRYHAALNARGIKK